MFGSQRLSPTDVVPNGAAPVLREDSADENLLAFVQSPSCRRRIWAHVFDKPHVIVKVNVMSPNTPVSLIASNSTDSPIW